MAEQAKHYKNPGGLYNWQIFQTKRGEYSRRGEKLSRFVNLHSHNCHVLPIEFSPIILFSQKTIILPFPELLVSVVQAKLKEYRYYLLHRNRRSKNGMLRARLLSLKFLTMNVKWEIENAGASRPRLNKNP